MVVLLWLVVLPWFSKFNAPPSRTLRLCTFGRSRHLEMEAIRGRGYTDSAVHMTGKPRSSRSLPAMSELGSIASFWSSADYSRSSPGSGHRHGRSACLKRAPIAEAGPTRSPRQHAREARVAFAINYDGN